jgi:hypothetical protein
MATRRDVIDAFYDELVSHATGDFTVTYDDGSTETLTLTSDDVDRTNPESAEKVDAVFFSPEAHAHVEFNGVGNGPDHVELNDDGSVDYVQWTEYVDALYYVYVRGSSPPREEPVYEAIRRGFGKYSQGRWSPSSIHGDVRDLDVDDATPAHSDELEDAIWGDQIEMRVGFKRHFIVESGGSMTMDEAVEAVENIAQVNLEIDNDLDDGTDGFSYTVT